MKAERTVRVVVGTIFVMAGTGKLLLPVLIPVLRPGAPTFGAILAALDVPLPHVTAALVDLVEIIGGLCLLAGRLIPTACAVLLVDMLGALATLSVPATFLGRPLHLGGLELGNEPWRVPLEVALSIAMIGLGRLWRRDRVRDAILLRNRAA